MLEFLKKVLSCHELQASPVIRAQRVGFFFNIEGFRSGIEKKSGRFGSGKSIEIFFRLFPGTLSILRYFHVFWLFWGIPVVREILGLPKISGNTQPILFSRAGVD